MVATIEFMSNIIRRGLPNLLRKYRKARGLTQKDVARILGMHRDRVSRWEQGLCLPTLSNAFRLAAVYRVLMDALFDDLSRVIRKDVFSREKNDQALSAATNNG